MLCDFMNSYNFFQSRKSSPAGVHPSIMTVTHSHSHYFSGTSASMPIIVIIHIIIHIFKIFPRILNESSRFFIILFLDDFKKSLSLLIQRHVFDIVDCTLGDWVEEVGKILIFFEK